MNKKKLAQQRRDIFKAMEKEFIDELVPAAFSEGEEDDQAGVLTIFMEDVVVEGGETTGEFFFMPMDEEEAGIQIFVNLYTLLEEADKEHAGELLAAVSIINAYMPLGAYAYDPSNNNLVYRYSQVMEAELSNEALKNEMEIAMSAALQTAERFTYLLIEVNDGIRNAASVSAFLSSAGKVEE